MSKAVKAFLVLTAAAVALQLLPMLLLEMDGDLPVFLYFANLYGVIPVCAVVLPYMSGKRGVHPFAAFFPIGLALYLFPVYAADALALLCMLISLIASAAGQEKKRRDEQNADSKKDKRNNRKYRGKNRG